MGLLDSLCDMSFKKDSNCNVLYFPWGNFGSGFVIKTNEKEKSIRGFMKKNIVVSIPLAVMVLLIFEHWSGSVWFGFILFAAYLVWYQSMLLKFARDLSKSTEKLSWSESINNQVKSCSWLAFVIMEIFIIVGVILGVWLLYRKQEWLVFFVRTIPLTLAAAWVGRMMFIKYKH
jgi:ABC-type phosphate transport system permease subunit